MVTVMQPNRTAAQQATGPRRYAPDEAREIVDEVWRVGLEDAYKRIWEHPFTRDLEAGTLPIEVVRGFIGNWYILAQDVNAAFGASSYGRRQFYNRYPEIEELQAEGVADEFTAPGPGGHQRTIQQVGLALGISQDELNHWQCIPEMRAHLDNVVIGVYEGQAASPNISEEWLSEWFRVWSRSLKTHYGLSGEDVFYFDMHSEADGSGEHYGGPTVDADVMGHADRARYMAQKALEAGLGPADPLRTWTRISLASTDGSLMMLDGCYNRFYPRQAAV